MTLEILIFLHISNLASSSYRNWSRKTDQSIKFMKIRVPSSDTCKKSTAVCACCLSSAEKETYTLLGFAT